MAVDKLERCVGAEVCRDVCESKFSAAFYCKYHNSPSVTVAQKWILPKPVANI